MFQEIYNSIGRFHCDTDLKVSRSQAKIDENFVNYFLETKAYNSNSVFSKSGNGMEKCKEKGKTIFYNIVKQTKNKI